MKTWALVGVLLALSGCTTPIMLPSSGAWDDSTVMLGPVVACKGGNSDFSEHADECNHWPISIASMPSPDVHYAELRAKAAQQYAIDAGVIVLRDVHVTYSTEINGVIRGWRADAVAGKRLLLNTSPRLSAPGQ